MDHIARRRLRSLLARWHGGGSEIMRVYVTALCLGLVSCQAGGDEPTRTHPDTGAGRNKPAMRGEGLHVLAPGESYAGKSLEEWALEYSRWSYSQTTCDSPVSDPSGALCSLYQDDSDSPVFFLERSDYGGMIGSP